MESSIWLLTGAGVVLVMALAIVVWVNRPGDSSRSCLQYYAQMKHPPADAVRWCQAGSYFAWSSTLARNKAYGPLNIFYVSAGSPHKPAIVLIHGYPTSSYDFVRLVDALKDDFSLWALDTPGYGFSDKPKDGYQYSLTDDARLVDYFVREIARLQHFILLTHDKGDSVGLALLQIYQSYAVRPYCIDHHIVTNGNIYLPLAKLRIGQKMLLNPVIGPVLSRALNGSRLAKSMAALTYTPPLTRSDIAALASIFEYQSGVRVEHALIQHLNERKVNEVNWLETLGKSDIPTTLIWGEQDIIAPPAVADYVWTTYLSQRSGRHAPARYFRIPCANRYIQVDQPALLASLIRSSVNPDATLPHTSDAACQPIEIA